MSLDLSGELWAFLPTQHAGRREIKYALAAVLISALIFLITVPYAKLPLSQVPAFIPAYVSSLVLCDLITAALLFGQFSVLRSVSLLVLAGGYLFTACITIAYALIFPGLFFLQGFAHAGPQTSSAMYMFWHIGFPLAVIVYTLCKPKALDRTMCPRLLGVEHFAILATVMGVLFVVGGFTLFATMGHQYIPIFMVGDRTTLVGHTALAMVWLLSLAALIILGRRKPHTVLDVWLLVVLCVWLFDIGLAALLNTGRYDLGWYVGRIYGLLAASFLLIMLLLENGRQYSRLVQMSIELSEANKTLAQLTRHDSLTGLANRRYFDEYLNQQIALAYRHKRSLALVFCDVDNFKAFNDHYGHLAGDECLKRVAVALQSSCQRTEDFAARYGGEEFAIILPETELTGARTVAEAARSALACMKIPHAQSVTGHHVSISCGVAILGLKADISVQQLIETADRALYMAKDQGRDRVVSMEAIPESVASTNSIPHSEYPVAP